ncbi:TIGR04283 family arsenosugar biosynthesis glycosyltransferase [Granulosicoccaceae sp. 1_MG-2023]|nr:TIGR04283 family arsenosugar biosynthesis glycosyltransferase [Granulosicoccaceae sp. 1_MG-2023]
MPVLNDAPALAAQAAFFALLRDRGHESVVVDGGSSDDSLAVAEAIADRVIQAPRGRAVQMNAGARAASRNLLWFVHADSVVGVAQLRALEALQGEAFWGRFDVRLDASGALYRVIGNMMNLRSRVTGIATGDQAVFVTAALFRETGGYPPIPLMEDIALSRQLRRRSRPQCLPQQLLASARYWQRHGVLRSILTMWGLRLAYCLGADPAWLHRVYYGRPPA